MLDPRAVADFLEEPKDDHDWIKSVPVEELDAALALLDPPPQFVTPMRKHSKACFLLGVTYREFFYKLCMGAGKTSLSLELVNYFITNGMAKRFIVTAPTEEVVKGWRDEIEKWGFPIPFVLLLGSSEEKWDKLAGLDQGICAVTYQGLATMVSEIVREKKGKKGVMKPTPKKVKALKQKVNGLIIDESTFVGNHDSLYYRTCNAISKEVDFRYALAGRAFGRDPTMLWSQHFLVDRGETYGPTLGLFREVFFNKKKNPFGGAYSFDYTFDKRLDEDFLRIGKHRSIYYGPDDADLDLPPAIPLRRYVSIPRSTEAYLEKLQQELKDARGDYSRTELAFCRLRQLSSGFLGFKDDETGEKASIEFEENPKLDLLLSLIDEMPQESKGLIIHEFTWSGRKICEALKKAGHKCGWVWSGTKDYDDIKRKFDKDPDFRFLVVNHKKGGYGLNLQAANYTFYYESPVSPIDRDQTDKRTHRPGQLSSRVFLYDLITRGTMDERILDFHSEGDGLFAALVSQDSRAYGV